MLSFYPRSSMSYYTALSVEMDIPTSQEARELSLRSLLLKTMREYIVDAIEAGSCSFDYYIYQGNGQLCNSSGKVIRLHLQKYKIQIVPRKTNT